jgi:hypothetical protein
MKFVNKLSVISLIVLMFSFINIADSGTGGAGDSCKSNSDCKNGYSCQQGSNGKYTCQDRDNHRSHL